MSFQVPVDQLLVFFLVLSRVSGMVLLTPVFSSTNMPVQVRAFIAVSLSLLVTPLQAVDIPSIDNSILNLAPLFGGEILIGLMLGFGIRLIFNGVQLTGQIIGHMSGMQLADVFDPASNTNMPVFSQLLDMTMVAVFLAIGGHRQVVRALLDSFGNVPIGHAKMQQSAITDIQDMIAASFHLGLQIGAPAMISLLLATLILGFISRTLPQINAVQVGFNLNAIVVFLVLMGSLGAAAMIFEGHFDWAMNRLSDLPFAETPPADSAATDTPVP